MSNEMRISAYSTALFSTWFLIDPLGILFDCGDGLVSRTLQKSRKVKNAFISHPDRDHLGGLPAFLQLNSRSELRIHYPKDAGSFPALQEFLSKFDPHISAATWVPIGQQSTISVENQLEVVANRNQHVDCPEDVIKSLSYFLVRTRKKLRTEFQHLKGNELGKLRAELGDEKILEKKREILLAYSGDCPTEQDGRYQNAKVLIHEATFLSRQDLNANSDKNRHSFLGEVMEMVSDSKVENLILSHFSSRYSHDEIVEAVEEQKKRCGIKIPVHLILPGELKKIAFPC